MWNVRAIRPNSIQAEGQLTFGFGEIIQVTGGDEREGWLKGRKSNGEEGIFPLNFVQEVPQTVVNQLNDQHVPLNITSNERDFDNEDTFSQRSFPPAFKPRKQLRIASQNVPKFTASPKSMKIYDWTILYEHNIDDNDERVASLQNHLSGTQVMTWYTQEIVPIIKTISWEQCKSRMLNRFGISCSRPIIGAVNRIFEQNDSVGKYYTEKLSLLNQTTLPEIDKIALLTHGMPKRLQQVLAHCSSTDDWKKTATLFCEEFDNALPKNFSGMTSINKEDKNEVEIYTERDYLKTLRDAINAMIESLRNLWTSVTRSITNSVTPKPIIEVDDDQP